MKLIHIKLVFLTVLALFITHNSSAAFTCKMLFTQIPPTSIAWSLTKKSLSRSEETKLLQLYSLKQLINDEVIDFNKVKELYQSNPHEIKVIYIRQTTFNTLKFVTSLPQPLIWAAPKEVFTGKLLNNSKRLLGAGLLYRLLLPTRLVNMGAKLLPKLSLPKTKFLDQKRMRIEIKSLIFHNYHSFYKTPQSSQKDYIDYREKREFLTKTELMTFETYELLKQYPRVFDKMISHKKFDVDLVRRTMNLPRPYLRFIENQLETEQQSIVFMSSSSQPIGLGVLSLFVRVLKELTGAPVSFYNLSEQKEKIQLFSTHRL